MTLPAMRTPTLLMDAAGSTTDRSISAPSTLAVNFARENNQTLIAFLRPPSFNIYAHVERVILGDA